MAKIIGRKAELAELQQLYDSKKSEFVALYGRRRVGKTYLVRNAFEGRINFQFSATANSKMSIQLTYFNIALQEASGRELPLAGNWIQAFQQLIDYLQNLPEGRKVVFIDEMPWLDTPKSDFMPALEHFWNSWASVRTDILLIVCGSASSWITNKLINNKGGLHNRITQRIKLQQFTLRECEEYLQELEISWERRDIAACYMIIGGIPFYWSLLKKGKSLAQNIDYLFFSEISPLRDEFRNLYASLFKHHEKYVQIVELLASKASRLLRSEIVEQLGDNSGGGLTRILDDLETCGFIRKVYHLGNKVQNAVYQLADFYTLYYFHFLKTPVIKTANWWSTMQNTPAFSAWSGYAFEQVCIAHTHSILQSLSIGGVQSNIFPWRSKQKKGGAQIDLIIDRNDNVVNLCEMKYVNKSFSISADYAEELRNKIDVFQQETKCRKSIFLTMITTYGLATNKYSGMVQNSLTIDDLFL